jgi:putative peptide zinc metalloprotease protein
LARKLNKWCLGLEEPEDPFLPQRNQAFFAFYSVASAIYRWIVLFSILWFLYNVLEPYGLKVVSQMLAMISVAGLVIQPLWKIGKFFYIPGRLQQVKKKNVRITLAVVAAVAAFVFFVPLPYRIRCALEVKPRDAQSVYVAVPGELAEINVRPGDRVGANQPLGKLNSIELLLQIADLKGKVDLYTSKVSGLEMRRFEDPVANQDLATTQKSLEMYKEQLNEKERDLERLVLKSPVEGTVIPPPGIPERQAHDGELRTFSGTPLREVNLGAHLPESTLFCQIGDPTKMEAVLVVDQDEIEFMDENQTVDIKIDELPGRTYRTTIAEIAKADLKVAPRQLSNKGGGEIATKTDESGADRPINISYQARAPLDNSDGLLFVGVRGQAKVHARWQTLWTRGVRLFMRTFNFKL